MSRTIPVEDLPIFTFATPPDPAFDYSEGAVLLVQKPKKWTSFDVVEVIRDLTGAKTGHAGTLDPMAEGLLIVCCGKATKSIKFFQQRDKHYYAEVTFGGSTPSYDAEMEIDEEAPYEHIESDQIQKVLQEEFTGDIKQYPPVYSAIKQKGKKLYEMAREGKDVTVYPRIVSIHEIDLLAYEPPVAKLQIRCGGGTYIRSVAHDLGKALQSRAYLSKLTRTAIGEFTNEQALTIDQFKEAFIQDG